MEPRRVAAVQFLTPRIEPRGSENLVRGGKNAVQNLDRIAVQNLDRVFGPAVPRIWFAGPDSRSRIWTAFSVLLFKSK